MKDETWVQINVCTPADGDYCVQCGRLLTLIDEPSEASPAETVILIQGEAECCCGDYTADWHHVNASCIDCCPHPRGNGIYEGKSAGGGYYIPSPR